MTDELQVVYDNLTFNDVCTLIREKMRNMAANYVAIGFFLRIAKDKELYRAGGYESIHDMALDKFGMARQTADHCMRINKKFSENGNSPMLADDFKDFSKSQLQEMLYLTDEKIDEVTPDMTVREIREVKKSDEDSGKALSRPDEHEKEYLDAFAKYFIRCHHKWFGQDIHNRVLMVNRSPDEIKKHIGMDHRTWNFRVENGIAHINLFDDYIQLWNENGKYMGDYDWFYLAAAIQSMWNEVIFEMANEEREKEESEKCSTSSMAESSQKQDEPTWKERCEKGECPPDTVNCLRVEWGSSEEEQKIGHAECEKCWKQWKKKNDILYPDSSSCQNNDGGIGSAHSDEEVKEPCIEGPCQDEEPVEVIDGECREIPDDDVSENEELTDIQILQEFLESQKNLLNFSLKEIGEEDDQTRKLKLIVAAIASYIFELDAIENPTEPDEPVQPELPVMKNNEQRKAWLRNYKDWGLWYRDENIGVEYYKYDFDNGARLIAEVYVSPGYGLHPRPFETAYLHLVGGPEPKRGSYGIGKWQRNENYAKYPNSDTELIEFLKEVQRNG